MRPPKNDRQRQSRRRGFDDDNFFGNTPPLPPSFSGFGSPSSAPESKATVKWYNSEKGFGFVEMADGSGDVFLHANSLQQAGFHVSQSGLSFTSGGQGQGAGSQGANQPAYAKSIPIDAPPDALAFVSAARASSAGGLDITI